jgi:hypothetical protein
VFDEKNWELKRYENNRRNLKKIERMEKLYGITDGSLKANLRGGVHASGSGGVRGEVEKIEY